MSKDRMTKKRGGYYTVNEDNTELSVVLRDIPPPVHEFSANWADVVVRHDAVELMFGQVAPGSGRNLLVVRVRRDQVEGMVRRDEGFIKKLLDEAPAGDSDPESVDWREAKYLLQDANLILMAYAGHEAELNFYRIPVMDLHLAFAGKAAVDYQGPHGVVTVTVTKHQLSWIIQRVITLLGRE